MKLGRLNLCGVAAGLIGVTLTAGGAGAQSVPNFSDPFGGQNECRNSPSQCGSGDIRINASRSQTTRAALGAGLQSNFADDSPVFEALTPSEIEIMRGGVVRQVDANRTQTVDLEEHIGVERDGAGNITRSKVTANEQRSTLNQTQLRAAEDRISTAEGEIDVLQGRATDHATRLNSVESVAGSAESRSISNRDRISTVEGDLRTTTNRSIDNRNRSQRNETSINNNRVLIEDNGAGILENRTQIENNETDIGANRALIDDNEGRITNNETSIGAQRTLINDNETRSLSNEFRLDNLASGLEGFEHRIGGLEKRVNDMQKDIDRVGAITMALDNPGMSNSGVGKVAVYGGAATVSGQVGFGVGLNFQVTEALRIHGGGGTDIAGEKWAAKVGGVFTLN